MTVLAFSKEVFFSPGVDAGDSLVRASDALASCGRFIGLRLGFAYLNTVLHITSKMINIIKQSPQSMALRVRFSNSALA
jgi:hypothetical protein